MAYLTSENKDIFLQLIDNSRNIAIICHQGPDGDAVGASLALSSVLSRIGKSVTVAAPDDVPKSYASIPLIASVRSFFSNRKEVEEALSSADLIFCLDFNSPDRIGKMKDAVMKSKARRVQIDHHEAPTLEVDFLISDPNCCSTAMMVYKVINEMGLGEHIDKLVAEYVFTGMMTDTGNFSYNSRDPEIYEIISHCLRLGVDKDKIYREILNTNTEARIRIFGHLLDKCMTIDNNLRAAFIRLSKADMNAYRYEKGITEGLVNIPLSIPDIDYSFYLREDPECIRISARSKGTNDVSKICAAMGGGGHTNAAGAELVTTLDLAEARVKELLTNELANENNITE